MKLPLQLRDRPTWVVSAAKLGSGADSLQQSKAHDASLPANAGYPGDNDAALSD